MIDNVSAGRHTHRLPDSDELEQILHEPHWSAKKRETRVFYALFIPDTEINACVDTIRYVIDPMEKWRAHITVRGPYLRRLSRADTRRLNDRLRGNCVTIDGIGRFESRQQNTVYFKCNGTLLKDVWNKRDYGYEPHITLYDGTSDLIASQLEEVVGSYDYDLSFRSDRLEPLVSTKGALRLDLALEYDLALTADVLGHGLDMDDVTEMSMPERLRLVDGVCRHLSALSRSRR